MKSFLTFVNEQESVKYQWGVNDFFRKGTIAYDVYQLIGKILKNKYDKIDDSAVNELVEYLKSKFNKLDFDAYVDKKFDSIFINARRPGSKFEYAQYDFEDHLKISALQEFLDKLEPARSK